MDRAGNAHPWLPKMGDEKAEAGGSRFNVRTAESSAYHPFRLGLPRQCPPAQHIVADVASLLKSWPRPPCSMAAMPMFLPERSIVVNLVTAALAANLARRVGVSLGVLRAADAGPGKQVGLDEDSFNRGLQVSLAARQALGDALSDTQAVLSKGHHVILEEPTVHAAAVAFANALFVMGRDFALYGPDGNGPQLARALQLDPQGRVVLPASPA